MKRKIIDKTRFFPFLGLGCICLLNYVYTSLTLKLQKSHFYVLLTKNPTYELNEKTQGKLRTKFFYHKIILTLSNKDQNHQKTHM